MNFIHGLAHNGRLSYMTRSFKKTPKEPDSAPKTPQRTPNRPCEETTQGNLPKENPQMSRLCKERVNNHAMSKYKYLIQMIQCEDEFELSKQEVRKFLRGKDADAKEKEKKQKKKGRIIKKWLKGKKKVIEEKRKGIEGKNIIFVAGLGGLGMEASRSIVKKGPKNFVIFGRKSKPEAIKELQDLNKETNVDFFPYDVTVHIDESRNLFKKVFDKYKTIDLLINGAGLLDDHQIERTIAVNFTGTVNTTTAIMDFWDKRFGGPGGVVANVCSVSGFNPIYQLPVYSASKAAVISFTISLAKLANITGVKAYSINPGITRAETKKNCNSWLDTEPCVGDLLLLHPSQTRMQLGYNMARAIEHEKNGVIWKLDQGNLVAVKWVGQSLWDAGI